MAEEDEQRKKSKVAPSVKAMQKHNVPAKTQKKPAACGLSSQRYCRPVFAKLDQAQLTVHKLTWMTNRGLQQKSCQSTSV